MRCVPTRPAAAIGLLLCIVFGGPARAQLLVNGNFEEGPPIPPANPILVVAPGNTALSGWTVSGGSIEIITDGYWVPLSGTRSVVLSSSGPGSIEQSFASSSGSIYRLTFWLSGEPFSTPTLKHLHVTTGPAGQDFTFDNTPAWHWDMAWQQHTIDFTADGPATTIRFTSMDASAWGPAIDSTKVELVAAGVGGGASALAFARISPDPVSSGGRMAFTLPAAGHVRLSVHDIQGRQVALLEDADLEAGPHDVAFAPHDWSVHAGVYLAVLHAGGRTLIRRFTVLD